MTGNVEGTTAYKLQLLEHTADATDLRVVSTCAKGWVEGTQGAHSAWG